MSVISEKEYNDVNSSLLNKHDEIIQFKGMFNCYYNNNSSYSVTFSKDSNNCDIIISPQFEYFKEVELKKCTHIYKTSSNVYNAGIYKTGTIEDIVNDGNPTALSSMNLFLSQFRNELKELYGKNINNPNVFYFDIETGSEKGKPINFEKYPILSIGYAVNSRKKFILDVKKVLEKQGKSFINIVKQYSSYSGLNNDPDILEAEKEILTQFFHLIEKAEIDILVGYNSGAFDIPYILYRAKKLKIKRDIILKIFRFSDAFGSNREDVYINSGKAINSIINGYNQVSGKIFNLYGRVHIDLYHLWHNKMKLKDVGVDLGIIKNKLDVDAGNMWNEYINNYDEFIRYLFLDIDLAREVFLIDFPRMSTNLEKLNCGLAFMATKSSTTEATQMFSNTMVDNQIFTPSHCTETNPLYLLLPRGYYNKNKRLKYAGAVVGVEQIGRLNKCVKYDVTSYYPNTIVSFELGLTNTQVSGIMPYNGKYNFINTKKFSYIIIPDHNLKYNLVLKRFNFTCPIVQVVIDSFKDRKIYKDLAKEHEEDKVKYFYYNSINESLKVVINGMYGSYARLKGISNPASAILTTGLGRYCLTNYISVIKHYTKLNGKTINPILEIDTDGVYKCFKYNLDECNEVMENIVETTNVAKKLTIKFEDEYFDKIHIKSAKNYIYQKEGKETFNLKGSSIQSKKHTNLEIKARKIFIDMYINQRKSINEVEENIESNFDSLFDINDFIIPKTNIKNINDYNLSSLERKLANQYKNSHGTSPEINSNLNYFVIDGSQTHLLATDKNIELLKNKKLYINKQFYIKKIKTMMIKEIK